MKPLLMLVILCWPLQAQGRGVAGCRHVSINAPTTEEAQWALRLWHQAIAQLAEEGKGLRCPVILHWEKRPGARRACAWLAGGNRRCHLVWITCGREDFPGVLREAIFQLARLEQGK